MPKLNRIQTDLGKDEGGIEVNCLGSGIWFKVARLGNPRYQQELEKLCKERHIRAVDRIPRDVLKIAFARGCIRGWSDLEDDDGKEIAYSREKCEELFLRPDFEAAYNDLVARAQDIESYRREDVEDIAGN